MNSSAHHRTATWLGVFERFDFAKVRLAGLRRSLLRHDDRQGLARTLFQVQNRSEMALAINSGRSGQSPSCSVMHGIITCGVGTGYDLARLYLLTDNCGILR